jgi:hypothetical protein
MTTFVDEDGEILGEWMTQDIARLEWKGAVEQTEASPGTDIPNRVVRHPVGSVEWRTQVVARHPRAYQKWSAAEDDQLREESARGDAIQTMSAAHQRQPGGIRSRLDKLGLSGT